MINIDLLRNKDSKTITSLVNRNVEKSELNKITEFDTERRKLIENIDLLRAKRNTTSKELSQMKDKPQNVIDDMRLLGKDIKDKEKELSQIAEQLNSLLLTIPNIPATDVPIGENEDLNKNDEIKIIQNLVKQRKEAADIYEKNNRSELMENEMEELKILSLYLPKMMSEDELRALIESILSETGAKNMSDMGKVMPEIMKRSAGKADGKMAQQIVSKLLQ